MTRDSRQPTREQLVSSRARFISELEPRLQALRQGLERVGLTDPDNNELNAVKRRVHAMAAAAAVLDFSAAADALRQAEAALMAAGSSPLAPVAQERVTRILDALPTLVLGGSVHLTRELDGELSRPLRSPLSLLVFGDPALARALVRGGPLQEAECEHSTDPAYLLSALRRLGPDAVVIDGDLLPDEGLVTQIQQVMDMAPVPIVVICGFHDPDLPSRFVQRGATRVLPAPADPWLVQRTLRQVCTSRFRPVTQHSAFACLTLKQLAAAISQEAERALVDAVEPGVRDVPIDFGSGSEVLGALWRALATLRALAAAAPEAIRFAPGGPNGCLPIAPGPHPSAAYSALTGPDTPVPLDGRSVLVADPDPERRAHLIGSLSRLGLRCGAAATIQQALRAAQLHWPDAILAAPDGAGFDGLQLAHGIEQDIALADVPVLLLTEVPAPAEADAGWLRPVLAQSLSQRSRLEQRLSQLDMLHGRLDGITPRLLLQLAAHYRPSCQVELRSGSLTFEVQLHRGAPSAASVFRDGRRVAYGDEVWGPLLGTRTGRFAVSPAPEGMESQFEGSLFTVLHATIERARAARRCLAPENLHEVARITLDPSALSQYLSECPRRVRALLTQLSDGIAPRELEQRADELSPRSILYMALEELCRRGAVIAVWGDDGADHLQEASGEPASAPAATDGLGFRPPSASSLPPPLHVKANPADLLPSLGDAVRDAVSAPSAPFDDDLPAHLRIESDSPWPPAHEASFDLSRPVSEPPDALAGSSSAPPSRDASLPPHVEAARAAWREAPTTEQGPVTTAPAGPLQRLLAPLSIVAVAVGITYLSLSAVRTGHLPTAEDPLSLRPSTELLTNRGALPPADAGSTGRGARAAQTPAAPASALEPAPGGGSDAPPVDVRFSAERLELPPGLSLQPSHGLAEIRSWKVQHIYVDGVFMGRYQNRLVPLSPGRYELRLGASVETPTYAFEIVAGERTRVVATLGATADREP